MDKPKLKSVLAFKPKDKNVWYTGIVSSFISDTQFYVKLIMPIEPQWYEDGDKTLYYFDEISQIKVLEL